MSNHLLTQYARQRADAIKQVDRPERRMAREARLARHPRRRWRAR